MQSLVPRTARFLTVTVALAALLMVLLSGVVFWAGMFQRYPYVVRVASFLCSFAMVVVLCGLVVTMRRLTSLARAAQCNEQRFLAASDSSYDSFFILESVRDADGAIVDFRFEFLNVNGAKLLSSTPEALRGQLLCERYPVNRTDGFFERYKHVVETGEGIKAEFPIDAKNIHASWLGHQVVKLGDGIAITTCDITDAKQKELLLLYLVHHDSLTGIPRRGLFDERLQQALQRAVGGEHFVGLLMVDLDHFKRVNDLLGHQAGDELLTHVATRLQAGVGAGDTVARMGGDEFVIVLDGLREPRQAAVVAEQLLEALQVPVTLEGHATQVAASIGVCVYPTDGKTAGALLKNADAAMYQAKAEGRNRVQVFTREMAASLERRREVEVMLRQALAGNEFKLVYQPRIDLESGHVTGVEALLRWHSPQLGLVMPGEFISIAEENGLIVPIGRWVIETACREMRQMYLERGRRLLLAVNVSPRQFQQETLAAEIAATLQRHHMQPRHLEVEITENLLLHESPRSRETFEAVRALGVAVSIDDFGTGYSSMSYLMRFRVERLKIDQSFVRSMTTDSDSDAICKAIIGLAKALHIAVVAEGVENATHRDLLCNLGCDEAQGNFYAVPVPMAELPAAIERIERMGLRRLAA